MCGTGHECCQTHTALTRVKRKMGETPPLPPSDGATLDEVATRTKISGLKHREPRLHQDEDELRRIVDLIPQYILVLVEEFVD